MEAERGFFRDAGPVILSLEKHPAWGRISASRFRQLAVGLLALAVTLAGITWGRVHVLANGYEIMELRGQRDQLLSENQRLHRRIGDLQSLDYVEATARGRLGMVDINPNQVINLHSESTAHHLAESVEALFGGHPTPRSALQP